MQGIVQKQVMPWRLFPKPTCNGSCSFPSEILIVILMDKRFQEQADKYVGARVRYAFLALAGALGFLQAWASRMDLISDTVSYLDIGDDIWRGHWSTAINGLWGPLYSAILGVAVGIVRPSPYWEYPLVHLVSFVIFLFALWGFDFLLRELTLFRREIKSADECSIPEWVWQATGYTIFLWTSLQVIEVSETNPDMLVAAFFYFACGFLVKIRRSAAGWREFLGFGLVLGFGYLTKSIMFPVSVLCLAAAAIMSRQQRWRLAGACAMFAIIAMPFVIGLSAERGRLTFGESGRYNYAVHVNHVPRTHWQGDVDYGRPMHGSRQICERPATFEFATPLPGTYPAWTDPSYWYEGIHSRVNWHRTMSISFRLLREELVFFFELHGSLIATLFLLLWVGGRKWGILDDLAAFWFLLLPAVGALSLYAMIHIEPRYLAPFIAAVVLCLFFSVHLPKSPLSGRLVAGAAIFVFAMFICPVESNSLHVREFVRDVLGRSHPDPNSYQAMAEEMHRLGLRPGDRVASLEYSLYGMSTWARLARVQIVAEVYYWPTLEESAGNDFWSAGDAAQQKVIEALRKTGARVIVSNAATGPSETAGWQRVGKTQYFAYWLSSQPSASSAIGATTARVAVN
jgi:hypothetical protein